MFDPELVEGDPFWREKIAGRFADCDLMVGIHSPFAVASPWVEAEQRAFSGPKLWLAIDPVFTSSPTSASASDKLIPFDEAITVLSARPRCHQPRAHGRHVLEPSCGEDRVARARQAQLELESFRALHSGMPHHKLEIAGHAARIGDGFMALQRVSAARTGNLYLGVLPVTNSQYREFVEASNYPEPPTWKRAEFRDDDAPVTGVNWFEAYAFAYWLGGSLPTETEWVAAATGGDPTRLYATATGEIDHRLAYFGQPFGAAPPAAATAYPPNGEGYYGMCGNTWEWCANSWGTHRVIRGGGCMDSAAFCTTRCRYRNAPIDRDCSVGFRVKIEVNVDRLSLKGEPT